MGRELAGIRVYGRRLAELQEVEMLDEGRWRYQAGRCHMMQRSKFVELRVLSRMTKAMFRAGAREHRVPPLSVPFSRLRSISLVHSNPNPIWPSKRSISWTLVVVSSNLCLISSPLCNLRQQGSDAIASRLHENASFNFKLRRSDVTVRTFIW